VRKSDGTFETHHFSRTQQPQVADDFGRKGGMTQSSERGLAEPLFGALTNPYRGIEAGT